LLATFFRAAASAEELRENVALVASLTSAFFNSLNSVFIIGSSLILIFEDIVSLGIVLKLEYEGIV